MIVQHEPWDHIVIGNYYDPILFEDMRKELIAWIPTTKNNPSYHKGLQKGKLTIRDIVTDDISKKELPKTNKCIESRPLTEDILQYFPNHRKHKKPLEMTSEINILLNDHDYPVHSENPQKIISVVTYVLPDTGRGTCIYNENKEYQFDIPWKPNNTFIFAGETLKTWHGYNCIPGKLRITINSFLWDKSIEYGDEHTEGYAKDRIKNMEITPREYPFPIN